MKLCNATAILDMIRTGELTIEAEGRTVLFLDDFRIGLRLRDEVMFPVGDLDLGGGDPPLERISLAVEGLRAGQWALGTSVERLTLPADVLGILNTRSKYARLGLEMLRSSWFVAPGFGYGKAAPIIFEMQAQTKVKGFSEKEAYAFLMLFRLEDPVKLDGRTYTARFPFGTKVLA